VSSNLAIDNGYSVETNLDELISINISSISYLSGQFGTTHLPYEFDGLGDYLRFLK